MYSTLAFSISVGYLRDSTELHPELEPFDFKAFNYIYSLFLP